MSTAAALLWPALGVSLGIAWADVVWALRPFAPARTSAVGVLLSLACGLFVVVLVAMRAGEMGNLAWAALAGGVMAGALLMSSAVMHRPPTEGDSSLFITDRELGQPRPPDHLWILVTGAPGSGKSALIDAMARHSRAGRSGRRWRLADQARTGTTQQAQATDLPLQSVDRQSVTLRFWESSRSDPGPDGQPLTEMNGIVFVIDPTRQAGLASSFPGTFRSPERTEFDQVPGALNMLRMAEDASRERRDAPIQIWVVISKADLLRFSIERRLINFPIHVGPSWYPQVTAMGLGERSRLAAAMGLPALTTEFGSLGWGGGSPWFAYSSGPAGPPDFGAPQLLDTMLETLL